MKRTEGADFSTERQVWHGCPPPLIVGCAPATPRALLDEQVPVALAEMIRAAAPQHEIHTVAAEAWQGLKNGELLRCAREAGYAVLITAVAQKSRNVPNGDAGSG